ncbi:MAG TPA: DUF2752 domain-containing protein [Pyrinomonadaceae bacterium]|jgi:hypothetical protein
MPFLGLPDISPASLLRNRWVSLGVTAAAAAQIGAVWAGVGGWPCPVLGLTGVPCPGCGLTRAAVALARGRWGESLATHAFAPLLLLALAAFAAAALLPRRQRDAFAAAAERLERRTRATAVLLAALLLYWSARVLFVPGAFGR